MGDYYYDLNNYSLCPSWAPVLGFGGCVAAVVFASEFRIQNCYRDVGDIGVFPPAGLCIGVKWRHVLLSDVQTNRALC
jgi:hypothetical protein